MTAICDRTVAVIEAPHKLRRALLPISCSNDRVAALDKSNNMEVLVACWCKIS
jgi:hypothetical protein